MPVRSILEIEINDSAFRAFQEKFNSYQAQLEELPAEWGKVSQTMAGLSGIMDKLNTASKAGPSNAMLVGKVTVDTKKIAADYALLWTGISKSSHFFLHDIIGATGHLTKWTALTGVFAGLLGAGGLFGISRLAMNAAGQRQSAKGLGVTTGQYSSFMVNAGTLTADPSGLLSKFSEGFYGQGARSDFAAAFGSGIGNRMQGKDAASFFADILPDLKRKLDTVPEAELGNYLKSSHLLNRGIDVDVAHRIRAMSTSDVGALSQRLSADAAAMNMPDAATKALQDLDTKLLETWNILSTDVETKLTPLTPSLTKLTDSFGAFAGKALEKGGAFDVVVKEAGDGISWLADELGTPTGREHFLTFVKDAAIAAVLIEGIIKSAPFAALLSPIGARRIGLLTAAAPELAVGLAAGYGLGSFLSDPLFHLGFGDRGNLSKLPETWNGTQFGVEPEGSPWNHQIPSHARGAWEVPQTGLAILHQGEMVVPRDHAEKVRNTRLALSTLSDYPAYNPGQLLVNEEKIGKDRIQAHMDWLQGELGLPKRSAAGITGNLSVESAHGQAFHELGRKLKKWNIGGISDIQFTGAERIPFEKFMTAHGYPLNSLEGTHAYMLVWPRSRGALETIQAHPEWSTAKVADYWASHVEIPGKAHMSAREDEAHRLAGEPVPHHPLHRPHFRHHHRHGHGMHPVHVMLMHRKPEVEIAMDGPGSWTVS